MAECETDIRVTREHPGDLYGTVRTVLTEGHARAVKGLLQALVVEIGVVGRNALQPVFRVPAGVRILDRVMGRGGLDPPTARSRHGGAAANVGLRHPVQF